MTSLQKGPNIKLIRKVFLMMLCIAGVLAMLPAEAHHSAAAFDPDIRVDITGTVARLEWTSPHARLYVDEVKPDGAVIHWNFELPSPVGLMRKGWRRNDLVPGDTVSVSGFRAKAYTDIAIAEAVRDGEGSYLFSGE